MRSARAAWPEACNGWNYRPTGPSGDRTHDPSTTYRLPDDPELRREVKTTAAVVDRLIAHIREQHSDDVQATPVT